MPRSGFSALHGMNPNLKKKKKNPMQFTSSERNFKSMKRKGDRRMKILDLYEDIFQLSNHLENIETSIGR